MLLEEVKIWASNGRVSSTSDAAKTLMVGVKGNSGYPLTQLFALGEYPRKLYSCGGCNLVVVLEWMVTEILFDGKVENKITKFI